MHDIKIKELFGALKDNGTSEEIDQLAEMQHGWDDVPQSVYVIEECSELIKELTKQQRGKGSNEKIADEACDVMLTLLVLLREMSMSDDDICHYMSSKLQRAMDRYERNGEI